MDRLGGLIHRLPRSAVISLAGTLGIAALPPLNGFVSEWLILQGLFQGFRTGSHLFGILIVLAAATLGLTGGLAIYAFVRGYGIPFLGMPRTRQAAEAAERGQPVAGPGLLAAACVALAVGPPLVLLALSRAVRTVTGVPLRPVLLPGKLTVIPAHTDFSAFFPTYLAVFLVAVTAVPLLIYLAGRPRAGSVTVPVWDGGMVAFKPGMQYSAMTFSAPPGSPSTRCTGHRSPCTARPTTRPGGQVRCTTRPRSPRSSSATCTAPSSAPSNGPPMWSGYCNLATSTSTSSMCSW